MFGIFKKRHLRYNSVREWARCEGIPFPVSEVPDEKLRSKYFDKYFELRKHLFNEHLKTLSPEELCQINNGQHPSQSHSRIQTAKEYAKELRLTLKEIGSITDVIVGVYHGDRLVLDVLAKKRLTDEQETKIPEFFRGFEVIGPFIQNRE
jgi:hypothetical protein